MIRKEPKIPTRKDDPSSKPEQDKTGKKTAENKRETDDVDRPGFDLRGSTGKTSAGTGVGLGPDAAEDGKDRSLPGRRVNVQSFGGKEKR